MKLKKFACCSVCALTMLQSCSAVRHGDGVNVLKVVLPVIGLVTIGTVAAWAFWPKKENKKEAEPKNNKTKSPVDTSSVSEESSGDEQTSDSRRHDDVNAGSTVKNADNGGRATSIGPINNSENDTTLSQVVLPSGNTASKSSLDIPHKKPTIPVISHYISSLPYDNSKDDNIDSNLLEIFTNFVREFQPEKNKYTLLSSENSLVPKGRLKCVPEDDIVESFDAARNLLATEPSLLKIDSKGKNVVFVGDLHGDIETARNATLYFLNEYNEGRAGTIVFLGDYGDRGRYSFEVLYLLSKLKSRMPNNVFMLRGNHDVDPIFSSIDIGLYNNSVFGDLTEYYGNEEYKKLVDDTNYPILKFQSKDICASDRVPVHRSLCDLYGSLPFAAVIDNNTFCAHASVPMDPIKDLEKIRKIDRADGESLINDNREKGVNDLAYRLIWPRIDYLYGTKHSFGGFDGFEKLEANNFTVYPEALDMFAKSNEITNIILGHSHLNRTYICEEVRNVTIGSSKNTLGGPPSICVLKPDGKTTVLKGSSKPGEFEVDIYGNRERIVERRRNNEN